MLSVMHVLTAPALPETLHVTVKAACARQDGRGDMCALQAKGGSGYGGAQVPHGQLR